MTADLHERGRGIDTRPNEVHELPGVEAIQVEDGETVKIVEAAKNWYRGRCSITFTGWTRVEVVGGD